MGDVKETTIRARSYELPTSCFLSHFLPFLLIFYSTTANKTFANSISVNTFKKIYLFHSPFNELHFLSLLDSFVCLSSLIRCYDKSRSFQNLAHNRISVSKVPIAVLSSVETLKKTSAHWPFFHFFLVCFNSDSLLIKLLSLWPKCFLLLP